VPDDDQRDEIDDTDDTQPIDVIEPISDPIGTARRKHGIAGAMLAGGLFGVDIALGRKPREEIPVVVDAAGEPTDLDNEGLNFPIDDETQVVAPALPRTPPVQTGTKRRR
jgi:hypothetical protein